MLCFFVLAPMNAASPRVGLPGMSGSFAVRSSHSDTAPLAGLSGRKQSLHGSVQPQREIGDRRNASRQLPDLRETQSGKDLIAIGKAEGKAEWLLKLLEIRFGEVPAALQEGIQKVDSDERIDQLYELALKISKLSDFKL